MFTREELNQLEQLKADNPKLRQLLDKYDQEQKYALSYLSHSIRNDLTVLMSSFQITEKCHPEVRDFKHWQECVKGAFYIRNLMEDLYDYEHSSTIHCSPIMLNELLTDLVDFFPHEHYSTASSVTLQTAEFCPEYNGDSLKLYHALELLLINAYEALPEENGKILLTLSCTNSLFQITISDNGKGFSKDMKKKLWQPFATDKQHHTGLGLCTAHGIILAHGGHMKLAWSGMEGTCIEVYLPIASIETLSGKCEKFVQHAN